MDLVCPQCNGLLEKRISCPRCRGMMQDRGKVSDYYGPYSPYEEVDELSAKLGENPLFCTHLFYCEHCAEDKRIDIHKIQM